MIEHALVSSRDRSSQEISCFECVCVCACHGQRFIIIVQFPFSLPSWGIHTLFSDKQILCKPPHANFQGKRAGDCGRLAWDMAATPGPFQPGPTGYQGSCRYKASRQIGKILIALTEIADHREPLVNDQSQHSPLQG